MQKQVCFILETISNKVMNSWDHGGAEGKAIER